LFDLVEVDCLNFVRKFEFLKQEYDLVLLANNRAPENSSGALLKLPSKGLVQELRASVINAFVGGLGALPASQT
jgi:hypothetical protein